MMSCIMMKLLSSAGVLGGNIVQVCYLLMLSGGWSKDRKLYGEKIIAYVTSVTRTTHKVVTNVWYMQFCFVPSDHGDH